ncbi:MAG: TrbI/VirB10 family protein, partial [Ignavibacteria bacterium]
VYVQGTPPKMAPGSTQILNENGEVVAVAPKDDGMRADNRKVLIKTGDILFAVIDTSINSDEPGPILATVVSGKFKGAKLIGSFNLPSNASKMVISFNTMSVPGASKSTSINAYAVDADTARTALSSSTNHHYFLRYGSLFASSFLEGFGNAFQSANTTVTVGGVNGGNDITVQNGIGRSALENAVIGLATVGKSWGQVAQQQFNTPVTVEVFSGTGVGILFTRDLTTL